MFSADNIEPIKKLVKKEYPELSDEEVFELAQRHSNLAKLMVEMWLKTEIPQKPP